jgi:LruC domain-containing protein
MILLNGCLDEKFEEFQEQNTDSSTVQSSFPGFDFKTTEVLSGTITVSDLSGKPVKGAHLEFFFSIPFDKNNQLKSNKSTFIEFQGNTGADGKLSFSLNYLPSYDSIYILTNHPGFPALSSFEINSNSNEFQLIGNFRTIPANEKGNSYSSQREDIPVLTTVNGYYVLGTWNSFGVPDYLENADDIISSAFLDDVNASLPENIRLPVSHPQYLSNNNDANLIVNEECEIWVTFVHEGAGWLNMLGYYTYQTSLPPASKEEIRDLTIIFPNVSYQNSGGGLHSGNKVQLFYLDPETNVYTKYFPANTEIGWFVTARGWTGQTISNGKYTHYSNAEFNAEPDDNLKKHNVLLYDNERDLLLLGFEDIRRDQGSDEDFNDAVFFTTVTPFTAVDQSVYQPIDKPTDTDNDGITDVFDDYPTDPEKGYNNFYPGENDYGTLVFEDLWPYKGDYDFNDLVIDYNFNQITNSSNKVVSIESKTVVRAIGASYHNAFGIEFNTPPANVSQVSGQQLIMDLVDIETNGTENGQSLATVIYFDNAYELLPYPGNDLCVNTYPETPYVSPDTQFVTIDLIVPVSIAQIGTPPYNPFIIVNQDREVEVHLPNKKPTDLVNLDILGSGHDNSRLNSNEYYISDKYLPWAINLPVSFDYPAEKEDITKTHLMFNSWAISLGYNYMDWYNNKPGYRNDGKIYPGRN